MIIIIIITTTTTTIIIIVIVINIDPGVLHCTWVQNEMLPLLTN